MIETLVFFLPDFAGLKDELEEGEEKPALVIVAYSTAETPILGRLAIISSCCWCCCCNISCCCLFKDAKET